MYTLNCKGKLLTLEKPIVMGIINVTPDSFYTGSRQQTIDSLLKHAEKMLQEGAVILDIGGQSTRPGAEQINIEEEKKRVLPAIEALYRHFSNAILSIDTYRADIAKEAVDAGASLVNDISGGTMNETMLTTVATLKIPFICTHMKGIPSTMQQKPMYKDVIKEVLAYFIEKIATCRKAGIHDVIIDPGLGFGKTIQHNFTLLKNLSIFKMLQKPILIGVSRKSAIYKTLGITADEALNGSTVLHTIGLSNGASILRAHDVKEAMETIKLLSAVNS